MKNTIIQWNCRGLRANYDELQLFFNDYDPAVVCLQETTPKELLEIIIFFICLLLVMDEAL